jgi:polyhydroxyalkanoate synthesis regulator phasin
MDEHAEPVEPAGDGAPASETDKGASSNARDLVEQLLLAGLGAVTLTRDKADSLLDDLASRGKLTREDADAIRDDLDRAPRSAPGLGERASAALGGLFRELGLATEPALEELALRVAQLEHRLRLLERRQTQADTPRPPE